MTEQTLEAGTTSAPPAASERLHRPARAAIAAVELLLAAAAVWAAFPIWSAGIETVTSRLTDGTELISTRYSGSWMGAAIALGTLAGVLVIDALRQLLLGLRAGRRRSRSAQPAHEQPARS